MIDSTAFVLEARIFLRQRVLWFGQFIVASLIACACSDRMWLILSTRRQHNLTVQTRVYAQTSPCAVCMCTPLSCLCFDRKVSWVDRLPLTD